MHRRFEIKSVFRRAYRKLSEPDKKLVDKALMQFESFLNTNQAPAGLGITHLGSGVYEFRAGLALRIVYVVESDQTLLMLLGTHDEVVRFLRKQ